MGNSAPGFYEKLSLSDLLKVLVQARFSTVTIEYLINSGALFFFSGLVVAAVGLTLSWRDRFSNLRRGVCAVQWLIVFPGWLGLWTIPFEIFEMPRNGVDGEWLDEWWALNQIAGVWLVLCAVVLAIDSRKRSSRFAV